MPLDLSVSWWRYPLVIVDFDTTGVDPLVAHPVSIAAVRLEQGEERGHLYTLLDPGEPIPAGATQIHGITDEMVKGAPKLASLTAQLCELAQGAVPCGYHGELYDKLILQRSIIGPDCPLIDARQPWIDPLVMIRKIDRYVKGAGRHKLEAVAARWGVPFEEGEAHNALADVRATGRVLAELVRQGNVSSACSLGRLLEYIGQVRVQQQADYERYRARVKAREAQTEMSFEAKEGQDDGRSDRG